MACPYPYSLTVHAAPVRRFRASHRTRGWLLTCAYRSSWLLSHDNRCSRGRRPTSRLSMASYTTEVYAARYRAEAAAASYFHRARRVLARFDRSTSLNRPLGRLLLYDAKCTSARTGRQEDGAVRAGSHCISPYPWNSHNCIATIAMAPYLLCSRLTRFDWRRRLYPFAALLPPSYRFSTFRSGRGSERIL